MTGASKAAISVPAVAVETQQNKPMPGETPPAAVPNLPTSPSVGSAYVDPQKSRSHGSVSSGGELVLLIKANSDTWAEVTDDTQAGFVQRLLKAGEESFNGASSFSVVLGNADGRAGFVRGQPVDLMARSKNNVARFDVKMNLNAPANFDAMTHPIPLPQPKQSNTHAVMVSWANRHVQVGRCACAHPVHDQHGYRQRGLRPPFR